MNLIDEISEYVLHHDDWEFGKKLESPILRLFTDFDFMWMYPKKGFEIVRIHFLNKTKKQMLNYLKDEIELHDFHLSKLKKLTKKMFENRLKGEMF